MTIHIVSLLKEGDALEVHIIDRAHQHKQVLHH